MITNASGITLRHLRQTFGVQLNPDDNFFKVSQGWLGAYLNSGEYNF